MRDAVTALLLLPLVLGGCPPGPPAPPAGDGSSQPPPASAPAGQPGGPDASPPADPLAGSLFSQEELFELYAAEQAGGERREAALRKHRLLDAAGQPVPAREAAYERALKTYAAQDPEGWAAFLESLPR